MRDPKARGIITAEMEKIAAARSMVWSIELEKGLRSKDPSRRIEAIERVGLNLEQWSKEPGITMAVADMYGLVPGEDRTFANAILLRLADAFSTRDNTIRKSILKIFLLELKHLIRKGKHYNGILAKQRVPNYEELLKRVKAVYDTGDATAKCLALRLYGCWADLAKDSAHIRYMILLSLQSSHVSEVKASLFSAGCICCLSEDFAFIMLGILIDMISSSKTSSDVKLAAINVFARMLSSSFSTNRAYKAGKELLAGLQQEVKLVAGMLLSLSKLACKSSPLIPEQVDLLMSIVSHNSSPVIKASGLKCLSSLIAEGACHYPVTWKVLTALLQIIDDGNLPHDFHLEAFQILQKICCRMFPSDIDVHEFLKLVQVMEHIARFSFTEKKLTALELLVSLLCCLKRERECHGFRYPKKLHAKCSQFQESSKVTAFGSGEDGGRLLVCQVASLICDHLTAVIKQTNPELDVDLLVMENIKSCGVLCRVRKECKPLLSLLLRLAECYPTSVIVLLDRIKCLIETQMGGLERLNVASTGNHTKGCEADLQTEEMISASKLPESDYAYKSSVVSELISCICRFVITCLKVLDRNGLANHEVFIMVKHIIAFLRRIPSNTCDMYDIFHVCMHFSPMDHCFSFDTKDSPLSKHASKVYEKAGYSLDHCWFSQEWQSLGFIKQMLESRNYWAAYKAGKYCFSEGICFAAAFTFRKLLDHVKSEAYQCWFKSLILLSGSESEVKLLLFPTAGIELANALQTEGDSSKHFDGKANLFVEENPVLTGFEVKLMMVHRRVCSLEQRLTACGDSNCCSFFHRWFVSLRSKVLGVLAEMLGLLNSHKYTDRNLEKGAEVQVPQQYVTHNIHTLVNGFGGISFQLNMLAKAYDLLAISFLDIDRASFRCISTLALNCSLLAFSAAFALSFLNSPAYQNATSCILGKSENLPSSILVQDLVERLLGLDDQIIVELQQFFISCGEPMGHLQSRTQIDSPGYRNSPTQLISRFSIARILKIQEASKGVKDNGDLCELFMQGVQLLSDIIRKWMEMPFQTPKYFFRVRPSIGAEIFIFNADPRMQDKVSIFPGFQLSLNICIQLKNFKTHAQTRKMYSILAANSSDRVITGEEGIRQADIVLDDHKIEEMVQLNELLLLYMKSDIQKANQRQSKFGVCNGMVTAFICCDPNERGCGFSSCLLDVSAFPEGSYQIKWHSSCIDENGAYWSLMPLNAGSVFTVKQP